MKDSGKIPKLIIIFFVVDFLLIALFIINWAIGQPFIKLTSFLDIDGENGMAAWYSSIQLFTVSIFFLVFAIEYFDWKDMETWILFFFPAIFLTLSLDEIAMIHEWIGKKSDILLAGGSRKNTPFHITGIWMFLIGVPFFIVMMSLFHFLKKYLVLRRKIFKRFIVGFMIFFISAIGIEALSNFVLTKSMAYMMLLCLEELGEMAGITFILWATYDLLLYHDISIQIPPIDRKRS